MQSAANILCRLSTTTHMKKPVKNIIKTNIDNNPKMNDSRFDFDLDFRLTLTKIGKIGKMHGDNIEITPVVNEISGRISI